MSSDGPPTHNDSIKRDDWLTASGARLSLVPNGDTVQALHESAGQTVELSTRAENVLKELTIELANETPPRGRWIPSDIFLERLTYTDLLTARNCGPQTTAEIVKWARTRGIIVKPNFRARRVLSAMWQDIIKTFESGEIPKVEIAEVLENSIRRQNTRIPVEFQKVLLAMMNSSND